MRFGTEVTLTGPWRSPAQMLVEQEIRAGERSVHDPATAGALGLVRRLERAAAQAPWVLATMDAVVETASLRGAARLLQVHHSTLQDRLSSAEALLGWDVRTADGRLRLHLALVLRRAARAQGPS